jgi:magnesium transporter
MDSFRTHSSSKKDLPPGTVVYVGTNPPQPTQIILHVYDENSYTRIESADFQIIEHAIKSKKHLWIDIAGLANVELINSLCELLGVHPLIIEDIVNTRQRPKLESFNDFLFLVFKLIDSSAKHFDDKGEQFSLLSKKNLLLTFRESNNYNFSSIYQRLSTELSMIREEGSNYLTYLVIDGIVDHYFLYIEKTGGILEKMEDLIIANPDHVSLQNIYTVKRRTLLLRQTIAPLRDMMKLLLSDSGLIEPRYILYYRDLGDHISRIMESIDLHNDVAGGMMEIHLSSLNNNMSKSMKILTQFASIFIPLSFIASVYGMNFEFMPELKWHYGYPAVLLFMASVVVYLLFYFKRKKIF